MSIELKQAAQDAAEAIDWLLKNIRLDAPQLSGKAMGNAEKCASALRTAIQQAEAQQLAKGEPVLDVRCEGCGYMTHHREHMGCVRAAKQHTHPAPSAPVTPEPVLDATLTKHLQASAPAPWEVSFHKTVTGKPFGIVTGGQPGSGRMDIVICHGPDAYDEPLSFKAFLANAPLIAAAPKLLDALELIANAGNSALDLAYCKGVASAAIGASATTSR